MGKCKIVYNDTILIDLSQDSVTPETLDEGVTAHDKDGNPIVGTRSSEDLTAEIEDQAALIEEQTERIEELLTALNGKASGGSGGYETCTLKINGYTETDDFDAIAFNQVLYPVLNERGSVIWKPLDDGGNYFSSSIEIENVVIGQIVVIYYMFLGDYRIDTVSNAELVLNDKAVTNALLIRCTKENDISIVSMTEIGF